MKRKLPYFRIWNTDFAAYTQDLTNAEVGQLIRALVKVSLGYEKPKISKNIEIIWELFEDHLIDDIEKYKTQIVKSQKGGAARGRQQAANRHSQPEPEPEPIKKDTNVSKKENGKKIGTRLADDWTLPQDWGDWAEAKGMKGNEIIREGEKFKNYWISKTGKDATKINWQATWQNWIYNNLERRY